MNSRERLALRAICSFWGMTGLPMTMSQLAECCGLDCGDVAAADGAFDLVEAGLAAWVADAPPRDRTTARATRPPVEPTLLGRSIDDVLARLDAIEEG